MHSNRLRELRENRKLTQTSVANSLHMGQSTYNRYERGVREPDHETLKQIANFFKTSVDYIIGHDYPQSRLPVNVELREFLLRGSFLINRKTPTVADRELLARILASVFPEEPRTIVSASELIKGA